MPVTVVVGGQFGSEGKGKVAHYLTKTMGASYAVRCGGSNSGHTVVDDNGKTWIFRHLPTAAILPDVKLAICAGSYIDVEVLSKEIEEVGITPDRLIIDQEAVVITPECKDAEKDLGLIQNIGSTGSGTGVAVANRVLRKASVVLAKTHRILLPFIGNVASELRTSLNRKERIILEGTQGFGLSPLHSGFFPKVTSRDTTAAAVVSEAGLSPLDVDDIALVIRAFPIRVAGDSGSLENETSWDEISKSGNFSTPITEMTTVTKRVRRVGLFDSKIVNQAILVNNPTKIFLNHIDYFNSDILLVKKRAQNFLNTIIQNINSRIDFVGTSPSNIEALSHFLGQ